jgi:voltage-gated potassium channel
MDRDERQRRVQQRQTTRQERVQRWLDRNTAKKGLRPRYAAYLVIAVWLVAIVVFGVFQRIADPATFPTIWSAWWWAIQTVTTVGYGDVVPHQTSGKVVASFLMLGGLSFLSVLTALITSSFVARRQQELRMDGSEPLVQEMERLSARIDSLTAELERARGDASTAEPRGGSAPG